MISAPRSASCSVPHGPAPNCSTARIRTSASGKRHAITWGAGGGSRRRYSSRRGVACGSYSRRRLPLLVRSSRTSWLQPRRLRSIERRVAAGRAPSTPAGRCSRCAATIAVASTGRSHVCRRALAAVSGDPTCPAYRVSARRFRRAACSCGGRSGRDCGAFEAALYEASLLRGRRTSRASAQISSGGRALPSSTRRCGRRSGQRHELRTARTLRRSRTRRERPEHAACLARPSTALHWRTAGVERLLVGEPLVPRSWSVARDARPGITARLLVSLADAAAERATGGS